jgi:predicted acylesterase/phospholipase RssA
MSFILNVSDFPTDPHWRLIATYAPFVIAVWVSWLFYAIRSGKATESQYVWHRSAIASTAIPIVLQYPWPWIIGSGLLCLLLAWSIGLILRLKALPSGVSIAELKQRTIALVVIGGGAKGAYQVGVFKALWELGIRRFAAIAGTSVGAMNGFLMANQNPAQLEEVWHKAVEGNILKRKPDHYLRLLGLLVGEVLLLCPYLLTLGALLYFRHKPVDKTAVVIAILGNAVIFEFISFRFLEQRGWVFPLFRLTPEKGVSWGRYILVIACSVFIAAHPRIFTDRSGLPLHPVLFLAAIFGAGLILAIPIVAGLRLVTASLEHGLYPRVKLNELTSQIAEHATYPNCTGPVWATVSQYANYLNPWNVPLDSPWPPRRRETGWTPRYINLRTANVADVLRSTSAIPFAFKAESLDQRLTVDGGVTDNEPVTPAMTVKPDVVIFIGANRGDYIAPNIGLQWKVQRTWNQSYYSSFADDSAADEVRRKLEREHQNNPQSDLRAVVPDMLRVEELRKVLFLSISPSWELFFGFPRLRDYLGTMRFTEKFVRKQISDGYDDTKAYFETIGS